MRHNLFYRYIVLSVLILWPAFLVFLFDFKFHQYINDFNVYPTGVDYIVNHWLTNESGWKSTYVLAWCLNGYLIMIVYIFYLLRSDVKSWIDRVKSTSYLMLLAMIVFGFFCGWATYTGWIFSPARNPSSEIEKMLYGDFNLLIIYPVVWVFSSLMILFSIMFSVVFVVKFFDKNSK